MDKLVKSTIDFHSYHINDIYFKLNNDFESDDEIEVEYKIGRDIKLIEDFKASVTLKISILEAEPKRPFNLTLSMTGIFSVHTDEELSQEQFLIMCKMNCTSIMFPFLRSAIVDITKACNIPPLIIPVVNIAEMLKEEEI